MNKVRMEILKIEVMSCQEGPVHVQSFEIFYKNETFLRAPTIRKNTPFLNFSTVILLPSSQPDVIKTSEEKYKNRKFIRKVEPGKETLSTIGAPYNKEGTKVNLQLLNSSRPGGERSQ